MKPDKEKMRKTYGENTEESFFACSAQDCTGLIPALPRDGEELEAYAELYPYLKKPVRDRKDDRKKDN